MFDVFIIQCNSKPFAFLAMISAMAFEKSFFKSVGSKILNYSSLLIFMNCGTRNSKY